MQFDYKTYHIDCRAHHDEDGRYCAQARITVVPSGEAHFRCHDSGEIDSFVSESDAIACARSWAIEWCDDHSM
ncbi:hypothetical protein [Paraburkholderia sp.]|uniref:hypothetical protein n=1 Tax=Paraburkholderia sp. TaxID=1926495 RepID=UPI00239FE327|nr:hypothetical protein [Paraburkholderia sp.]MDE1180369.1 hypothetical protein [Paraburkholderia sp.]